MKRNIIVFMLLVFPFGCFAQEWTANERANSEIDFFAQNELTEDEESLALAEETQQNGAQPFTLQNGTQPIMLTNLPADFDYKNTPAWQANRVKKLSAGICIGLGLTATGLSALICAIANAEGGGMPSGMAAAMFGTSAAITLTSIPLFISASKDRKKARQQAANQDFYPKRDYRRTGLRYELFGGTTVPWDDVIGSRKLGWLVGAEARTYLGMSPFDLAFRLQADKTCYDEGLGWKYGFGALRMSVLADWNMLPGRTVNPFVGVGLGTSLNLYPYVHPRLGVELFDHHRLSAGFTLSFDKNPYSHGKEISNLYLAYGYTF